jgi:hypothetical protein
MALLRLDLDNLGQINLFVGEQQAAYELRQPLRTADKP